MDSPQQQTPQNKPGGYGKRPKWQWVLLYIVVAIVVYGAIYYLFFRKTGGDGTGGGYQY